MNEQKVCWSEARISPKLSVVMPIYNERQTIQEILWRVQAVNIEKEIVIIDDGSTDGTREFLRDLVESTQRDSKTMTLPRIGYHMRTDNIRIFFQERNCGKGAALRRGFQEAKGAIVVVQDADLETDPQDYYKLLEPIERDIADVVYGSRFLGRPGRVAVFWHYIGNRVLTKFSNMFTSMNLSDVWTCYKAFRNEILQTIQLREDRFGFELEITAKVAKGGWRVVEVPISYWGRTHAEGKKITYLDGLKGVWWILRYNLFA